MSANGKGTAHSRRWARVRSHFVTFILTDLKKNWYIIPAVGLLMFLLESIGLMRGMATYALDAFILAQLEKPSTEVVIVVIDDDDYQGLYGGKSPLNQVELQKLLTSIQSGNPRLIAVDLDVAHVTSTDFPWTPRTVWGRDAQTSKERSRTTHTLVPSELPANFQQSFGADGVIRTEPPSGLAVFPLDADGVVRRYSRLLATSVENESSHEGRFAYSLPWAIIEAYHSDTSHKEPASGVHSTTHHHDHDLILSFTTDSFHFPRFSCGNIRDMAEKGLLEQEISGRIVIVGGTYSAARDLHATPVGALPGVEIVAEAVEAELNQTGIRPFSHKLSILFDFVVGLLFLYLGYVIPIRWNFLITIPLIGLLSLLTSLLAFHAFAYWVNFSVVLVSLWVHLLWEKAKEHNDLRAECKAYHDRYGPLLAPPASTNTDEADYCI